MNKENISDKQGICTVILFVVGTASIIVTGIDAGKDLWIATILSILMALIMVTIYARINYIFDGKDLFDVLEICFGKIIGKIIGLSYIWFAFHLSALVLRDFGELYASIAVEIPVIIPMIGISILGICVVKEGIEVICRYSEFFVPIVIILMLTAVFFLIPNMNIDNITPILDKGIKPILSGGFSSFSFPFAETVIFMMIFSKLNSLNSPYKIYISGIIISGVVLLITSTANILVLGVDIASINYFPAYAALKRLEIGTFIQRLEIIIAFVFVMGGFIKVNICALGASKGLAKVFGFEDYRFIVVPLYLCIINFSYFQSDSRDEFFQWTFEVWRYYAFLFQVIFPIIIIIAAEIKFRSNKNIKNLK